VMCAGIFVMCAAVRLAGNRALVSPERFPEIFVHNRTRQSADAHEGMERRLVGRLWPIGCRRRGVACVAFAGHGVHNITCGRTLPGGRECG